jgi:signal peptidase II
MQTKRRTPLINPINKLRVHRIIIWVAFLSCGLDIASKKIVLDSLGSEPKKIVGSFLQLHLAFNSGAAFSIAPSATYFFTLFSLAIALLTIFLSKKINSRPWAYVSGLILGGIGGNLLDRVFRAPSFLRGDVIDWIQVPHWPIFNLADCAISFAALLACILTFRDIHPTQSDSNSSQHRKDKTRYEKKRKVDTKNYDNS